MAKRKQEDPPKGSPAWMATFSDLMNLLLCFFVLLFSMSTVDAQKFEMIVASMQSTFSILDGGGSAVGEGVLISSGVSQLNNLDYYYNNMGKQSDSDAETEEMKEYAQQALKESEEMAENIEEMVKQANLTDEIETDFTSQYVLLTLNGALLFDSGSADIKEESIPILEKVGAILTTYDDHIIEVEGHTDNVPINNRYFKNNNELSSFRALAVAEYFIDDIKLDPTTFKYSGRGEYVPVAENSTPEGRAKNRRVEIKIYNTYAAY